MKKEKNDKKKLFSSFCYFSFTYGRLLDSVLKMLLLCSTYAQRNWNWNLVPFFILQFFPRSWNTRTRFFKFSLFCVQLLFFMQMEPWKITITMTIFVFFIHLLWNLWYLDVFYFIFYTVVVLSKWKILVKHIDYYICVHFIQQEHRNMIST